MFHLFFLSSPQFFFYIFKRTTSNNFILRRVRARFVNFSFSYNIFFYNFIFRVKRKRNKLQMLIQVRALLHVFVCMRVCVLVESAYDCASLCVLCVPYMCGKCKFACMCGLASSIVNVLVCWNVVTTMQRHGKCQSIVCARCAYTHDDMFVTVESE